MSGKKYNEPRTTRNPKQKRISGPCEMETIFSKKLKAIFKTEKTLKKEKPLVFRIIIWVPKKTKIKEENEKNPKILEYKVKILILSNFPLLH